jgi:putative membrane protein
MNGFQPQAFFNAFIYAMLGIVIFALSFAIWDKLTPYDLWKEIIEGKNMALAIMVGFMSLGMCVIIAAAVH